MTTERLIKLPPLESGDRLTRDEFERRYAAMPDHERAELIEGVVCVASPLRARAHGKPHGDIMGWLWTYKTATPGIELYDNPTVRLDVDNEPQPDAVLHLEQGGRSWISEDDYLEAGEYKSLAADASGIFRSQQFPGLWLAGDRLLSGNIAAVLQVLQQGTASLEHQTFIEALH